MREAQIMITRITSRIRHWKTSWQIRRSANVHNIDVGANVSLGNARFEGNNVINAHTYFTGCVELGWASTIGHHNILVAGPTTIKIGRYCQFGPYVSLYASMHPMHLVTLYQNRRLLNGALKQHGPSEPIVVGSDVWCGLSTIILPGVTIGHGSIIGAGAVVVSDIPDYAVAVGNPARVVKQRFDDKIVELLLRLRWWDYSDEGIEAIRDLFFCDFKRERQRAIELLNESIDKLAGYPMRSTELISLK